MMRPSHGILLILFTALLAASAAAQSGSTGLSFLKIGVGGRTIAMGDAGVASAEHGNASHYNPALLAPQRQPCVSLMHNQWVQDVTTQYLGAVLPVEGLTLGFHLGLSSASEIEIREVPGEPTGTFASRFFTSGITAAFALSDEIDVGATAKFLFEKISVDEASGYAFDVGLAVHPFDEGDLKPLKAGFALENLGSMSALRTQETKLPSLLRYGMSYEIPLATLSGALLVEADGLTLLDAKTTHFNIGAEVDYDHSLFVRLGYQTNYESKGFSAGIGASYSILRFDYAVTPWSDGFGLAHTISLSFIF
jgi:hypothetical protein